MVSGLDLLREQPRKSGIELLRQPREGAKSGLDLLRPTKPTTEAPTTEVPKAPRSMWQMPELKGETIQEKMMATGNPIARRTITSVGVHSGKLSGSVILLIISMITKAAPA